MADPVPAVAPQPDIALLFARNPLDTPYTPEELKAVVEHYRAARQRILLGVPKPPSKAAAAKAPMLNLDVEI